MTNTYPNGISYNKPIPTPKLSSNANFSITNTNNSPRLSISKTKLSEEDINKTVNFFESYQVCKKMLIINEIDYACQNKDEQKNATLAYNLVCLKSKMSDVENFILDNQPKNKTLQEYHLFLHCHYILGMTIEKTAEEIFISRSTAYRIKKKAIEYAAELLKNVDIV